jgi:acetyl-CoA synthetase
MTRKPTSRSIIAKSGGELAVRHNLHDYDRACAAFTWSRERTELGGDHLNIADVAIDRHVRGGHGARVALRWRGRDDIGRNITFAELQASSLRTASLLRDLGIGKGDMVAVLMPRRPELFEVAFGTWRNRSIFLPLFAALGPEPLRTRLDLAKARVLVTTATLYRRKIADIRHELTSLDHVLLVDATDLKEEAPNTWPYRERRDSVEAAFTESPAKADDFAILHFTSGTTGPPKGAIHIHEAVVAHHATAKFALDLCLDDVYWCTADPGWVTGTSYGIIAPLAVGATAVVNEQEFDPAGWYRRLAEERVSVWYTSPTAIRMLMHAGSDLPGRHDFSALRLIASVGEPLNPDAIFWAKETFGQPILDTWWQTETGAIMISNFAAIDIRPGAMGLPVPGIEAAVMHRDADGGVKPLEQPETVGELALKTGWPSMFRGYFDNEARYRQSFRDGWYLSGDLVRRDQDGYYWFIGRADDVIKSAGHLIGPFEVESVLHDHPSVADVAVVGKKDPLVGALVVAYIVLRNGEKPGYELKRQLLAHARRRLGAAIAPRDIVFRHKLPKTESGKIKRRLLAEDPSATPFDQRRCDPSG